MQNNRTNPPPQDEEPIDEQTRRIIRDLPISPAMYDGTYPAYEGFHTVSPASVSELSFSSESPDSDSTVHYQAVREKATEPIVELPSTPSKEEHHPHDCTVCPDTETFSPSSIGAALEKSGTVLMQRSLDNRLAKQLEEMHALMGNDDELVVLKQPSIRSMSSRPAFTRDMMQEFMEHSETMFNLVHDTQTNSGQFVIGIEEADASDTEAPGPSQRKEKLASVAPPPATVAGDKQENEFVGCFSKDNDMVLYKRTMQDSRPKAAREDRKSIDSLIAHHAECLVEANETNSPAVHVRQVNDDNLLALLTFSDQSSAVLKISNTLADGLETEEQLNQAILTSYRKLVATPDEMISMQTQTTSAKKPKQHTHQLRPGVLQNLSAAISSFELTNASGRDGLVVQRSSKNWTKCSTGYQNAADTVLNLRLLLEEYILRNIAVSATVVKFVSHVLSDVLGCTAIEIGEDFRALSLIDKIKRVFDELLMPHDLEDPLVMVNELRYTIEEIRSRPLQTARIFTHGADAWEYVLEELEKLSCELDHEVEHPEVFLAALQYGLGLIVAPPSKPPSVHKPDTKTVSIDPALPDSQDVFPSSSNMIDMDRYEAPSVSFCKPYACFVQQMISNVWSALVWVAVQLNVFWDFLQSPPPPILADPSVSSSSHQSVPSGIAWERAHDLNKAADVFRIALEDAPDSAPDSADLEDGKRSVNDRSLQMITRLLHHAANIELQHSVSRHNIRLQLNTSVSGVLEKREADEFLTMAGNVRDRDANVAIFFEARLVDLDSVAKVESAIECVTRIERFSNDADESEDLSEETIVHIRALGEDEPSESERVVSSLVEEMVSNGAYEDVMSRTGAEQLLGEIKHCLQDLLEPLTTAVGHIYEQCGVVGGESSFPAQTNASEHYNVELKETTTIAVDDDKGNVHNVDAASSLHHCPMLCQLAGSLEELLSLFHDTNDRLGMMDADITAIRNQVQQLLAVQQHRDHPRDDAKTTHGDGKRLSNRRARHSQKPKGTPFPQCPMQQPVFAQLGKYCPTEIYSCHAVAPDVLVVHWTVDEDMLHSIGGFEILVDGVLRSVCFSNKRRTALINSIDLQKHHQIALHATPDSNCKNSVDWAPAFFLYHT
uniref:Uncharacterized protein n=1 Tax=Anopheles dirus TaxID=7168 RepID=A0A182N4I3_9DIPT